jgi:hypothetical protein
VRVEAHPDDPNLAPVGSDVNAFVLVQQIERRAFGEGARDRGQTGESAGGA